MQTVPTNFQPKHPIKYPEDNTNEFERWFFENWKPEDKRDRTYLPILWTGYFCKHKYGRDHGAKMQLQRFVNSLDKSKSYYSILQYDSGPLIKLPANVKLMAMSGPVIHYPLPLICEPHNFHLNGTERTIFANFVGALTHPCRKGIVEHLSNKPEYFISTQRKSLTEFCHLLSKSVFTLCPRGFRGNVIQDSGGITMRICACLYLRLAHYTTRQRIRLRGFNSLQRRTFDRREAEGNSCRSY